MALVLPAAAMAGDLVFDCGAPDAAYPEMVVHLTKYYGQKRGHITIGDVTREVDVFSGLGTLTFLYIDEGYALHYSVDPGKGTYTYSVAGKVSGEGRGTCTQLDG
jgi:hypothetical protein